MSAIACSTCGHRLSPAEVAAGTTRCPACNGPLNETQATGTPTPATEAMLPESSRAQGTASTLAEAGPGSGTGTRLPTVPGYEVLEEVGRGGMGVVYKARQLFPRRVVALKMILDLDSGDADRLARFRAEVAAAARLQHPNIVPIHEVGEHNGRPYFSMEYVEGGTLAQHLAGKPQPPDVAAALVEQLARAVHHAHERGVVHRDLKPANILLPKNGTRRNADSADLRGSKEEKTPVLIRENPLDPRSSASHSLLPKITDFGLAKQMEGAWSQAPGPRTQSGAILGTPSYMAPEQAGGKSKKIGPAVDVHALGVLLYECLTGTLPFTGPTALETLLKVATEEPVSPRQLRPEVPPDLETICLRCLHKEPAKRYASAADLAEDLRRFRAGEAIQARPQSALERVGRWARRRRELVYLAGGALLAVVLGVVLLHFWPSPVTSPPSPEEANGDLPADLRLIPDDALGFVTVRAGELWTLRELNDWVESDPESLDKTTPEAIGRGIKQFIGIHPREVERATVIFNDSANQPTFLVVLATTQPYSPEQLRRGLADPGSLRQGKPVDIKSVEEQHAGKTIIRLPGGGQDLAFCPFTERILLIGTTATVRRAVSSSTRPPTPSPLHAEVQRAAEKHAVVAGFRPPEDVAPWLAQLGLGAAASPLGKVRRAGLVADIVPIDPQSPARQLRFEGWLDFPDAGQAAAAQPHAGAVLRTLLPTPDGELLQWFTSLRNVLIRLREAAWDRDDALLRATVQVDWKQEEFAANLRERVSRSRSESNLRRIAAALKKYHEVHGRFPPAVVTDDKGNPLYSWRVLVLPYLGEPILYRRFHLNRAWNHPSNAALVQQMPRVFASPLPNASRETTPYQVVRGERGLFDHPDGRSLAEITDGASKTLLVVEATPALAWTKPDELTFTTEHLPRLGGVLTGGSHVAMADGSVRFLRADMPERVLRALLTRAGGEAEDVSNVRPGRRP